MVVISADDHICEPPDMFDNVLSGELLASAPKNRTDKNGITTGSTRAIFVL